MKFKRVIPAAVMLLLPWALTGCNAGMAPAGSADDVKSAYEKMSPAEKIKFINSSPMPAADKAKKIKEIEDQTGVKDTVDGARETAH